MLTRRIAKKLVTLWTVLPFYFDLVAARTFAVRQSLLATRSGRLLVLAVGPGLALAFALLGFRSLAALLALLMLPAPAERVARSLRQACAVRRLARRHWPMETLVPAADGLRQIGLDANRVAQLLERAGRETEVRLAAFDQDNRIASDVGPIPLFEGWHVEPAAFRNRIRHRLELVIVHGVVAIKKSYRDVGSMRNEVLALHALRDVHGVPRIVALRLSDRVLYQSFIPGANLGSLMAQQGAPVSAQHEMSIGYPGSGRWSEAAAQRPERTQCLASLRTVTDAGFAGALGSLLDRIHRAGVAIRDVKYGNVIIRHGEPHLCDFDGARVYPSNSLRFLTERQNERDQFNYFFGRHLLSDAVFDEEVRGLAERRPDLFYAPVYYGRGRTVGAIGSIELGTGKWRFIRRHLPDIADKTIVDLGTNNAMIPLEMLRAGARSVTAYEVDAVFARYARLNHRRFEFIDNRTYDFELVEGPMRDVCETDLSRFQIATSFCSLYYEPPDQMARIARCLSRSVECFVVQGNENMEEHAGDLREYASLAFLQQLLADNGFPYQRAVRFSYYDRPLLIGRPSPFPHDGSAGSRTR